MSNNLTFHVLILPSGSWSEVAERFIHAESLGFDAAGIGDHFVDWTSPPRPWFEMWSSLSAVAARTSRIRLQTSVAQIPFRNPALFARQALTLDHISDGRVEIGLGTGLTSDPSYEMMGIPNWSAAERVARLGEYVEVVDRLLTNEITTYHGEYYRVEEAHMNPRPIQTPRPPITIAALGPKMMEHAVRLADTWDSLSFAAELGAQMEETESRIERIDRLCDDLGRDPSSLHRSYLAFDAKARPSGGLINYYESEDLFVEIVQRVTALGITEIGVYYPVLSEQIPGLERIATEVIPLLRAER
jgi:alkanesulfonate monooxygenase SsuD/methylene tetrahydromethanopterin reductase-like flavin-dependent oxidoreductase (luciferase family)